MNKTQQPTDLELKFIKRASQFLEKPSWAISMADHLGKPIEYAIEKLPDSIKNRIEGAAKVGIESALIVALKTLPSMPNPAETSNEQVELLFSRQLENAGKSRLAQNLVLTGTGVVGGAFGAIGTLVEIPISTSLIMRDMLKQGTLFGQETPEELITEALCLFTYGSQSKNDDSINSAYFTARYAFSELVRESGTYIAKHSSQMILEALKKGSAPVLIKLVSKIAARFNIPLSEKILAQSMPLVGALGGATINTLFADYYHNLAYFHFGLKNLERRYGEREIKNFYQTHLGLIETDVTKDKA